jgi:hypothetical protein
MLVAHRQVAAGGSRSSLRWYAGRCLSGGLPWPCLTQRSGSGPSSKETPHGRECDARWGKTHGRAGKSPLAHQPDQHHHQPAASNSRRVGHGDREPWPPPSGRCATVLPSDRLPATCDAGRGRDGREQSRPSGLRAPELGRCVAQRLLQWPVLHTDLRRGPVRHDARMPQQHLDGEGARGRGQRGERRHEVRHVAPRGRPPHQDASGGASVRAAPSGGGVLAQRLRRPTTPATARTTSHWCAIATRRSAGG